MASEFAPQKIPVSHHNWVDWCGKKMLNTHTHHSYPPPPPPPPRTTTTTTQHFHKGEGGGHIFPVTRFGRPSVHPHLNIYNFRKIHVLTVILIQFLIYFISTYIGVLHFMYVLGSLTPPPFTLNRCSCGKCCSHPHLCLHDNCALGAINYMVKCCQ